MQAITMRKILTTTITVAFAACIAFALGTAQASAVEPADQIAQPVQQADGATQTVAYVAGQIEQQDADLTTSSSELDFEYELKDDKVYITNYLGSEACVDIPETINGKTVVGVREDALADNEAIREITLPATITTMANGSISRLPNLKTLTVLGDLGYSRYSTDTWTYVRDCPALEEIHLGPDVQHYTEYKNRLSAQRYTVDAANTAYYTDEHGILYSSSDGFIEECPTLLTDAYLDLQNVKGFKTFAFALVETLETVSIHGANGLKMDYNIFYGCPKLRSLTATNVGEYFNMSAISQCAAFAELEVQGSGNTSLSLRSDGVQPATVTAGAGVRYITSNSYGGLCANHLVIGKDAVYFGYASSRAYENPDDEEISSVLQSVAYVSVDTENPRFTVKDNALFTHDMTTLFGLPGYDGSTEYAVPDGVNVVYREAFNGHQTLSDVTIPDTVTTIGPYALNNSQITRVLVPKQVNVIGEELLNNESKTATIEGYTDSYAQKYAEEQGYAFVAVDAPFEATYADSYGYEVWDGSECTEIAPTKGTYVVSTAAELAWIARATNNDEVDFRGKTVKLAADIDLCGYDWTPIGIPNHLFYGSFDGQGHTIRNVHPKVTNDYVGLFGCVASTVAGQSTYVKNLNIVGFEGRNASVCGGLSGTLSARKGCELEVSKVTVEGKISSCGTAGGIAAIGYCGEQDSNLVVNECNAIVDIASGGSTSSAGILTRVQYTKNYRENPIGFGATISKCTYTGNLTGSGWWGGKAGIVLTISDDGVKGKTTIRECVANGCISGVVYTNAAGITNGGGGKEIFIYRCVNNMDVTSGYDVGGIVSGAGGNMTIRECANDGYVASNATGSNCGGIAATNSGVIEDCVNLGSPERSWYTGGIAGNSSGTVQRCYDIGGVAKNSSAVQRSGAIVCYNTGKIYHSYFDLLLVESGKVSEYQGEQSVEDDALGYMTNLLKTKTPYKTWDFKDVWTFNRNYCYGYPVPKGLIGLMRKHKDKGSALSGDAARFTVVDQDGDPVDIAAVAYGTTVGTKEQGQTDDAGEVELKYHEDSKGVLVSKDGYLSYEDPDFELPSSREFTFRIADENKVGEFELMSAIMTYNGYRYELMSEAATLNKREDIEQFSIAVRLFKDSPNVDHYEIVQPDVKNDAIAMSTDGTFNVQAGDFDLTEYRTFANQFGKVKKRPIYVRVVDKSGGTHDSEINLTVVSQKSQNYELQVGKELSFKVPSDVAFFGDMEVTIPTYKLPLSFTIADDGSWELALNLASVDGLGAHNKRAKGEQATLGDTFKWFVSSLNKGVEKSSWSKKTETYHDALKDYMVYKNLPVAKRGHLPTNTSTNPESPFGFTIDLFGYASGDSLDTAKATNMTLKAYIVLKASYEQQWQTIVWVIPVVLDLEIEGSVTGGGELVISSEAGGVESGRVYVEPEVSIKGAAGVGVAYAAWAGIYGKATLGAKAQFFTKTKKDGWRQAYLEGDFGVEVNLAGGDLFTKDLVSGKAYIFNEDAKDAGLSTQSTSGSKKAKRETADSAGSGEGGGSIGTQSLMQAMSDATSNVLKTFDRSRYANIQDAWKPKNATLYANAYSGLAPMIAMCGGVPVMLFQADGDPDRATNDKSMLMFSIYDTAAKSWSSPAAVWDDGTADFTFDVASDGDNLYVVWTNEKAVIPEGSTYDSVLASSEVAIARFDAASAAFTDATNVTSNACYEIAPAVTLQAGAPVVSWTENATSPFRFGGANKLMIARGSGSSWTSHEAATFDGCIIMSAFGLMGGQPAIAYVTCDAESVNDATTFTTYLARETGGAVATKAAGATNVRFARVCGGDVLLFTDATGSLFTLSAPAGEPQATGTGVTGTIRQVVTDEASGNTAVLSTCNGDDNANAFACFYDAASATWSNEVAMTQRTDYVEGLTGCYLDGGIALAYSHRTINMSKKDYVGTNNLEFTRTSPASHLRATYLAFDPYKASPGSELPVTVTMENAGDKLAGGYRLVLADSQGTTYIDQTYDEVFPAGSTITKEFTLQLPDTLQKCTLTATVTDVGTTKKFDDASTSETLGADEIYIDARHYAVGKTHRLTISAVNQGAGAASGTIEVYDLANKTVYDSYVFSDLTRANDLCYSVPLTMFDWSKAQDVVLGVRLVGGDEVLGNHDRHVQITTAGALDVQAVSIDPAEIELGEDEPTAQLSASVLPGDAAGQGFAWWSQNEEVATVDDNGVVTAVSGGTTRVYARELGSGATCSCTVKSTLPIKVDSVSVSPDSLELTVSKNAQLTASVLPAEASYDAITWSSSDSAIARISADGMVTGVSPGKATITAEAGGKQATCQVEVLEREGFHVVTDIADLQSAHNYKPNQDDYWIWRGSPDAVMLKVTFDSMTCTESRYDYLYVYGNEDDGGGSDDEDESEKADRRRYSGTELAGATVLVPGNVLTVRLTSDSSTENYGFRVESIQEVTADDLPVTLEAGDGSDNTWEVGSIVPLAELVDAVQVPSSWDIAAVSSDESVIQILGGQRALFRSTGTATISFTMTAAVAGEQREVCNVEVLCSAESDGYGDVTTVVDDPRDIGKGDDSAWNASWIYIDNAARQISLTFGDDTGELIGSYDPLEVYVLDEEGEWKRVHSLNGSEAAGATVLIPSGSIKVTAPAPFIVSDFWSSEDEFALTDFTLSASATDIEVGDTITVTPVKIQPARYADMLLPMEWDTPWEIDQVGNYEFEAWDEGEGRIWLTMGGIERSVRITVRAGQVYVEDITLTGISTKIAAGKSVALGATVSPSNATNKKLAWSSSNTKVATVNASGVVSVKKKTGGKSVTITARATDGSGVAATYTIKSMKGAVKSVKIKGKSKVKAGKTLKLKAKVKAGKKANKKVVWTSSNPSIATVNGSGKVKASKAAKGKTVTITCRATDGTNKKAVKKVKIV